MRTIHFVEDPPRKAQPACSHDELVCMGIACATAVTLLALIELVHLSQIWG